MIAMAKQLQKICPEFGLRIVDVRCGISHLSCGAAVSTHPWKKPLRKFFEPVIKNNHLY
jgi:hypothetical protein